MKYFSEETIEKIRRGYYDAVYFNRIKEILLKEKNLKRVTIQIFQRKKGSILCGVEEVKELLKEATGFYEKDKWINKSEELETKSLLDEDRLMSFETVIHITGPYAFFAHLESIYLGILARRTLLATNMRNCVEAARGKSVIFFGDRFDYFLNQAGDGYAARIGGASAVCTEAMQEGFGKKPVGTIPHSLIAINDGDINKAAELFYKYFPDTNLIALVDFNNDCVRDSVAAAQKFGKKLWGVRLDTAADIADVNVKAQMSNVKTEEEKKNFFGVNPHLIRAVRKALDKEGFGYVKIVVSGGFDTEKIRKFSRIPAVSPLIKLNIEDII